MLSLPSPPPSESGNTPSGKTGTIQAIAGSILYHDLVPRPDKRFEVGGYRLLTWLLQVGGVVLSPGVLQQVGRVAGGPWASQRSTETTLSHAPSTLSRCVWR